MTRFVFLADTHLGACPMGYQQQPGRPDRLADRLAALRRSIAEQGGADFIVHGGDLVDAVSEENLRAAVAEWARLSMPVRLCLGNHDLTDPDAINRWRTLAPDFFPGIRPEYTIATPDCAIHIVPNHWCERPYFWKDLQRAWFSDDQRAWLRAELRTRPDLPHILVTHSPVFGLPPEQTGFAAPYHAPEETFTRTVVGLSAEYPHVRCVLGAHNHLNSRVERNGVQYVTVSSFVETPYEAKWLEVQPHRLTMRTVRWAGESAADPYLPDHAYAQGRPMDRAFDLILR